MATVSATVVVEAESADVPVRVTLLVVVTVAEPVPDPVALKNAAAIPAAPIARPAAAPMAITFLLNFGSLTSLSFCLVEFCLVEFQNCIHCVNCLIDPQGSVISSADPLCCVLPGRRVPALVKRKGGDRPWSANSRLSGSLCRFFSVSRLDEPLRPRVRGEQPEEGHADQGPHHELLVERVVDVEVPRRVHGVEDRSHPGHLAERDPEDDEESYESDEGGFPDGHRPDPDEGLLPHRPLVSAAEEHPPDATGR